ncbi:MAG: DUF169 domain-containing protein [Syntrophales bacterium]
MDPGVKERFIKLWKAYFAGAELPIAFYYTNEEQAVRIWKSAAHRCIFADMIEVRKGKSVSLDAHSIGCGGGKRYCGFLQELSPYFDFFLSCGLPGKVEGERYKKTPALVREFLKQVPEFRAPGRYIVFKRWDNLEEYDYPDVVIFFAGADVLSGLFALANFDRPDLNGVFAPFGAGCGTTIMYPYLEKDADVPRGVLGTFDISARPFVPADVLTFAVPFPRFIQMLDNMEESFLTTASWKKIRRRLQKTPA